MVSREPRQPNRRNIFGRAQRNIRNRLRTRRNRRTQSRLRPMRRQRHCRSNGGRQHLHLRRKLRACVIRHQRRNRNSNHRMQRVPDHIERRNLIRHKLDRKHDPAHHQHPGVPQRVQSRRQRHPLRTRQQPQRQHRGIDVQPSRKAGRNHKRRNVRRAEAHLAESVPSLERDRALLLFGRKLYRRTARLICAYCNRMKLSVIPAM